MIQIEQMVTANISATVPFSGWALSSATTLDQKGARGLVADLYRQTAPLKRQACFLSLAAIMSLDETQFVLRLPRSSSDLVEALRIHTARELARAALEVEHVPTSYLRALNRIGLQPLESPDHYRMLFGLCLGQSPASEAIRHCKVLTSVRLDAARTLDERLLSSSMLDSISSVDDYQAVNAGLAVLTKCCSSLSKEEGWRTLREYISRYGVRGLERMLYHADRLPSPALPAHPALIALTTAKEMERAAEAFKNCLKTRVAHAVLGRAAYFVVNIEAVGFPVVAELEPLSNGSWRLHHCEAPKGARFDDNRRKLVTSFLVDRGVVVVGRTPSHSALAELFQAYPLSFGPSLDDLEPK